MFLELSVVIMMNCGSYISCNSPPPEHNYVCCFVCFLSFFWTNHSCAPNCAWTCGVEPVNTKKMELRAIRDIGAQEEVVNRSCFSPLENWIIMGGGSSLNCNMLIIPRWQWAILWWNAGLHLIFKFDYFTLWALTFEITHWTVLGSLAQKKDKIV